jgi:hypothetical protein
VELPKLVQDKSLDSGYVKRIMKLIKSWARRFLIVINGRNGGARVGRMGGVIDFATMKGTLYVHSTLYLKLSSALDGVTT